MIKHIVFWDFETEEIRKEVVNRLEELPAKIDVIVDFEVGENFNSSDAAFQIALYSSFASKDDLQTYQVDPAHKSVAAFIGEVATSRAVVDYEI